MNELSTAVIINFLRLILSDTINLTTLVAVVSMHSLDCYCLYRQCSIALLCTLTPDMLDYSYANFLSPPLDNNQKSLSLPLLPSPQEGLIGQPIHYILVFKSNFLMIATFATKKELAKKLH